MQKDPLTYAIIGCAMKVHRIIGPGFQEKIYQRCLAIELENAGIDFVREQPFEIFYEGIHLGSRRADFLAEDRIIIELKAVVDLEPVHLVQAKNYVSGFGFERGLLINFGSPGLQFKLIFNDGHLRKPMKES